MSTIYYSRLWALVLKAKYGRRFVSNHRMCSKPTDSWLWRAIVFAWNILQEGLGWVIGNGEEVRFWEDRWVPTYGPLIREATRDIGEEERGRIISDFVSTSGAWQWDRVMDALPLAASVRIASVRPPSRGGNVRDIPYWLWSNCGEYTVASAYGYMEGLLDLPRDCIWSRIWRWEGPQRIRNFLWLLAHNKLLTNDERVRRHLTDSSICGACSTGVESVLHVLRDCPLAKDVWLQLVPPQRTNTFFSFALRDWLADNLTTRRNSSWPILFGSACWLLWKWRNEAIFQPSCSRPLVPARVVRSLSAAFTSSWSFSQEIAGRSRTWVEVGWSKPEPGFFKLNSDGAARGNPGPAGAGGILRDEDGNWIMGFMQGLGFASSVVAELWGVFTGLDMAWNTGCRHLVLEVDSMIVKDMVSGNAQYAIFLEPLLRGIRDLLRRDWLVTVRHVYREGNSCADWLARRAIALPFGVYLQHSVPNGLSSLLLGDIVGATIPRSIPL